jgi:hypothetical protein
VGGALARGEYGLGEDKILGGGQLDVGLLPGDDLYTTSVPLDQGGVVGCGAEELFGRVVQAAQQAETERLRRLYRPQVRPVQGLGDCAFPGDLDGVRDRDTRDDAVRLAPCAALTTRFMRSGVTRQRDPSCTSTMVSGSSGRRSRPFLVEKERASPGSAQAPYLLMPPARARLSILCPSPTA